MQYKLRKNLILAAGISSGALVMGVATWGIIHNYNVNKSNVQYKKLYFQNIDGKDVYFKVRDVNDTTAVLFANKYVKITRDAFLYGTNDKLYINETLLLNSLDLNLKDNPNNIMDYTFYPSGPVDGQTQIKARFVNAINGGIDAPINLTFYDTATNGDPLYRIGYYLQRPTNITEVPKTDQIEYRATENGENIYYMQPNTYASSYKNTTKYLHAKEYSSSIVSPDSFTKPIYYRFLDEFDFRLNEDNYIFHTIGLNNSNVELIEDLPENILEMNQHVDKPSSFENETYYVGLSSNSWNNTIHRIKWVWKEAN